MQRNVGMRPTHTAGGGRKLGTFPGRIERAAGFLSHMISVLSVESPSAQASGGCACAGARRPC